MPDQNFDRRKFLQHSTLTAFAAGAFSLLPKYDFAQLPLDPDINIIGPREGYSPQIGILVSQMEWVRNSVIEATKGLTQPQLDFLVDSQSNSIGALLFHLAATDTIYQDTTFFKLNDFSPSNKNKFGVAMELGDEGRKQIRGHDLNYYINLLTEAREITLKEFKKRDDKWFQQTIPNGFDDLPTNNFCMWFHVCEHEANHRGQMTVIRKRLPSIKPKA
jgi:uncharacterized damage-inducible protein DinB